MNSSIKTLIIEVLLEALWGKKFELAVYAQNREEKYIGIASKNTHPNELPYRISWFYGRDAMGHIDLTWEEVNEILATKRFSPEIVSRISKKWGIPKYKYTIRPLPPNVEKQSLTEGISLVVAGHKYDEQYENLGELGWWLGKKVQGPLMHKMPDEEKKIIKHDIITPDGGNVDESEGIMNVYIGFFPEKWRAKLLGGIEYFLKKNGVETGPWTVDQSKVYVNNNEPVQTVRIPITKLNPTKDAAPSVSMTYSTLKMIINLLKLDPNYFDDYMSSIPVEDLLEKIEEFQYTDEYMKIKADPGYDHVLSFINTLHDMGHWAKEHGHTHINGA